MQSNEGQQFVGGVPGMAQAEQSPDSVSMVELQWQKFQERKAANPSFAKYVATWNVRAEALIKLGNLQSQICSLTQDLEELRGRLSPEEIELL